MTADQNTQTPLPKTKNPREAAYLALLAASREERFISETLASWQKLNPSALDINLAQQLAYGASQMALTLDFFAEQLSTKKKLSLKLKERLLMRIALYQFYFLERLPIYAIADEMVTLARKYCHSLFVNYLNATLRNLPPIPPRLPSGDSIQELSIRYSYPPFLIESLMKDYGLAPCKTLLELGNTASPTMVRLRENASFPDDNLNMICNDPFRIGILKSSEALFSYTSNSQSYVQNATPAFLIGKLAQSISNPKRILDLCASPGGKLLAIHDLFPNAELNANDVSEDKLKRLQENCTKYGMKTTLSCGPGETFIDKKPYDIVILDVPCSNTGVLSKRPEARWRLSAASQQALALTQMKLIEHAKTLIGTNGEIWYITCSILKCENEKIIERACKEFRLKVRHQQSMLPNSEGWDGGFACALIQETGDAT